MSSLFALFFNVGDPIEFLSSLSKSNECNSFERLSDVLEPNLLNGKGLNEKFYKNLQGVF